MAITTTQGMKNGLQPGISVVKTGPGGNVFAGLGTSFWAGTGAGGATNAAGAFSASLNGVALSNATPGATPGSLWIPQASGSQVRLSRIDLNMQIGCHNLLCDRLWHNGGFTITSTSAQNIVSPAWPARDENGSSNGVGVMLAVEVETNTGAGSPIITVAYTNSDGVAGRSAVNIVPAASTTVARSFHFLSLQGGDVGVRSVQSLTLSETWTSGVVHLVAYRVISVTIQKFAQNQTSYDMLACGCPEFPHQSVIWPVNVNATTTAGGYSSAIYTSIG